MLTLQKRIVYQNKCLTIVSLSMFNALGNQWHPL